ncbi:MAG: hypothetical protein ACYDH9_14250 [Limisphaerales bacterium]
MKPESTPLFRQPITFCSIGGLLCWQSLAADAAKIGPNPPPAPGYATPSAVMAAILLKQAKLI